MSHPESDRARFFGEARTVVVKIGTNALSLPDGQLDHHRIQVLAAGVDRIRKTGREVVLVSSGAVGAGMGVLGLAQRPSDLPHLQAAAATGQAQLIQCYDQSFRTHGFHAGQVLCTANDFRQRGRYLNLRNTLETLLEYGVVPVVNENDTVSIKEIQFGDNDQLAAMVASLFEPSLLVILSNVDGFYDGDPADPQSRVLNTVREWNDELLSLASDKHSSRGTGGMRSKLNAIRLATSVGEPVILANGTRDDVLHRIVSGEEVGTLFLPRSSDVPMWKRWIGYTVAPHGRLLLDAGACDALRIKGRSLLAAGIAGVEGSFQQGEVVALCDECGEEFARGLTNYGVEDVRRMAGRRTDEIHSVLGALPYREVVHRNNLVLSGTPLLDQ